jgi:hypothetical protein
MPGRRVESADSCDHEQLFVQGQQDDDSRFSGVSLMGSSHTFDFLHSSHMNSGLAA